MEKRTELNGRRYGFDLTTIGLVLIVAISFVLHLFTRSFSGYSYAILLFAFTLLFIFSKQAAYRVGNNSWMTVLWLAAVMVMAVSFLHSQRSNGALLDVIVFTCGLLLLLFCSHREEVYARCLTLIKILALFFSAGILIQKFLPPLYRVLLQLFPSGYRAALSAGERSGFTLNAGYSAGYIIAGLLALLAGYYLRKRFRIRDVIIALIFLLALFLTGKRGPALFFVIAAVYCFLAPLRGAGKTEKYLKIFLIVLIVIGALWALRDVLSAVPVLDKLYSTVEGALGGDDVTSGRSRLYGWAIELFLMNPVFGIGWGRFRTTTIGNVTVAKELETHDIYLQLLAETGIIGFIVFMTVFILFWNTTRIAWCRCVRENDPGAAGWRSLLFFSFAYQTYFLLYGLTGNPLYDPHFQIMYIFACMIIVAYKGIEGRIMKGRTERETT